MINTDHSDCLISITVFGEFTLADFKEFEDLDFTLDVAWEEIQFSRQHSGDFQRIAVLSDSQWITWSAWLSQAFVDADLRVFDDEGEAHLWLEELQ